MKYFLIVVAALVLLVGGGFYWVSRTVSVAAGTTTNPVVVTIQPGEGVRDVAHDLKVRKLIVSEQAWNLYIILTGRRSALLAGEYTLKQTMTGREIATTLAAGHVDTGEVKVKILEGTTAKEIAAQLEKAGVISSTDFMTAIATNDSRTILPDKTYDFLRSKPSSVDLEGFLFPDTYRFFKKSTAAAVLRKFLDNFDARYTQAMRTATTGQGQTIFQEVTMASILEAELKTDVDRAMAADIFWRRLDAGMALNADTTVHYAIESNKPLTTADLQIDSPYNTYKYPGLPVGPIGNPGVSALRAAITPKANEYWYYLTALDGTTKYAKTLDEHNANKAQYLK